MNLETVNAERAAQVATGIAAAFDDKARTALASACGASAEQISKMSYEDQRQAGIESARELLQRGGL
jgi:hypothetical protein